MEVEKIIYPCIPLRGVIALPNVKVNFDISRKTSIKALDMAMEGDRLLYLCSQVDEFLEEPTFDDVYKKGVVAKVKQTLKISDELTRVVVTGLYPATVDVATIEDGVLKCTVNTEENTSLKYEDLDIEIKASLKVLWELYSQLLREQRKPPLQPYGEILKKADGEILTAIYETLAKSSFPVKTIQSLYEKDDLKELVEDAIKIVSDQIVLEKSAKEIKSKTNVKISENQKQYFLREQLKVIYEELGEESPTEEEERWISKLAELELDKETEEKILREIKKFSRTNQQSPDASVSRNYIETILELPWKNSSKINTNIKKAEKILEKDHYGLEKVKERILEYLAVIHLSKGIKGPILCLVGPPGVGKTSIARSIARATGREFVRLSLGGVRDEAEIRGHRRTYVGAIPGSIISNLQTVGTNNPLFLLDEIDKLCADYNGDPAAALLEVLDPEQNKTFKDRYIDIPFDLSSVLFITTANSTDTIPRPLLDRMEIIELSSYTENEKVEIAKKYLVPKEIANHGLKKESVKLSESVIHDIVNYYTREAGVRNLERQIARICRKVAKKTLASKKKNFTITPKSLENYLGKRRFFYDKVEGESEVGIVTGMAWTQVGGDTLEVETAIMDGSGKIELTGQLGEVMQESAKISLSHIRTLNKELNLPEEFYKNKDIHIHFPEGAVPKDGPSAGVTMFTSCVSALTKIPVKKDVAMTGEITLRGKILPVGGIKEKVLAAQRAGITKVLLPRENLRDLQDIPNNIRKKIEFVPLDFASEALEHALDKSE